jgi:hypothetical protein
MTLIQGFLLTFLSTDWTLAYRELMNTESSKLLPAAPVVPVEPAPRPKRKAPKRDIE